jgi:glucan phosphoethanolaminetransferase (alkaline phosphatase superfamily)
LVFSFLLSFLNHQIPIFFMRKAVTPVISVILIILLLMAIVAGTFYWINFTQEGLQEQGTQEAEQATSTEVPFSLVTLVCDFNTDVFSAVILNQGVNVIPGDTNFILTVSDINGVDLGSNISMMKSSQEDIPSNNAINIEATVENVDIQQYTEYIVSIIAGTSIQTAVCNSQ